MDRRLKRGSDSKKTKRVRSEDEVELHPTTITRTITLKRLRNENNPRVASTIRRPEKTFPTPNNHAQGLNLPNWLKNELSINRILKLAITTGDVQPLRDVLKNRKIRIKKKVREFERMKLRDDGKIKNKRPINPTTPDEQRTDED